MKGQELLEFLNGMFENVDDDWEVRKAFGYYHPISEQLANHPTIQAKKEGDRFYVSLIGLLNGLVTDGNPVARICDEDGSEGYPAEFCLYNKESK